jgi:hypothetical protein
LKIVGVASVRGCAQGCRGASGNQLSAFVHLSAMADCQNQYNHLFVLNVAQHPVVSDPVSPESGPVALQRFSEVPGVFAPLNSIIEPVENPLLNRPGQFSQLPFSNVADFNGPYQVRFSIV